MNNSPSTYRAVRCGEFGDMARKRQRADDYRYEATTVEGFLQQLTCYVRCGYWSYVKGEIRKGKNPRPIDADIIARYGIAVSKFTRHRDKACHRARVQYLRFGRTYLILATEGRHDFFRKETSIRLIERVPIKFEGHSISHEDGSVRVRIERDRALDLRAYFVSVATKRRAEDLQSEFFHLPFEPYGPVRKQLFGILKEVNELRKAAGMKPVPTAAVRWRRNKVKPFDPNEVSRWPKDESLRMPVELVPAERDGPLHRVED